MDLAMLLGLVGGAGIILSAILMGGELGIFIDIPSMFIVFGGTTFVVAGKYNINRLPTMIGVVMKAILNKSEPIDELIKKSMELAEAARKGGGPLGMQNVTVENPFFKKAVDMVVDGFDQEIIEEILLKEKKLTAQRHKDSIAVLRQAGDVAPAMGMIGTLIGLVQMLANMSDPAAIGPAMAIALLTTMYGAILANVVCFPVADKLDLRSAEEEESQALIVDAVLGIQKGLHPRVVRDALQNYIPRSTRTEEDEAGGEDAA